MLVAKEPPRTERAGGAVTAYLMLDDQEILKVQRKINFNIPSKRYMDEHAIDLGNVEVPWPTEKTEAVRKLSLQFRDENNDLVGEVSMLLEVRLIKL